MKEENNVKVPDNRFQATQETTLTEGANATVTPDNSYSISENAVSGSALKQEVAATVVKRGKGAGGGVDSLVNPVTFGLREGQYTGDSGVYLGTASGTPALNNDRQGGSRVDKKLSDANRDINLNASEQYATFFMEEPALREQKGTVGRNGNPSNVAVRSQKKTGFTPAEPLFDRSLDEIRQDAFIFTTGQVNKAQGTNYEDYPTISYDIVVDNGIRRFDKVDFEQERGNYSPRFIKVTLKKDSEGTPAYVSKFQVITDDFTHHDGINYHDIEDAASHARMDINAAEIARQNVDGKHGSPDSDRYSPLGRSVDQPSRTMMYLRDIEMNTGAVMAACLRFANKSRAYYLSRTGKDGQELVTPALDALYGHLFPAASAQDLQGFLGNRPDNQPFMSYIGCRRGSAYTLIRCFDSGSKYKTKADIVNQPRGLKLCLQTGMNNHAPLRAKSDFIKALNAIDVFSTIDRGYDPSSVVFSTDGVRYVMPYDWASSLEYSRTAWNAPKVYQSKVFTYAYMAGDGNQRYYVKVGEPILNGIAWFIEQHKSAIYDAIGNKDSEFDWYIPVVSYGNHFSLFDLMVSASAAYIEYERTNSLKDIIDLDTWGDYPFPDLKTISKSDILNPTNYGTISDVERLSVKEMSPAVAIRWMYPELFYDVGHGYMAPWYFNQADFCFNNTGNDPSFTANGKHSFTTPTVRSGVRSAYLDDFFGMDPRDVLFSLDRLVHIPGYPYGSTIPGGFYKYSQNSDGIPVIHTSGLEAITCHRVYKAPRQLGWIMPAFAGSCRVIGTYDGLVNYENSFSVDGDIRNKNTSFMARMYKAIPGTDPTYNGILGGVSQNVDRGQSFSQTWYDYYTTGDFTVHPEFDIMLSAAQGFNANGASILNRTMFKPFVHADYTGTDNTGAPHNQFNGGNSLISTMRLYWARIQKLPFVINPFDDADSTTSFVDPFDFAYLFGLAGFYAANYDEELQNRESQIMAEQFAFVSDPYIEHSPLFK